MQHPLPWLALPFLALRDTLFGAKVSSLKNFASAITEHLPPFMRISLVT